MTDTPAPHEGATPLRDRCKALNDKLQLDAILRQGSPVDTILEFVVSEIGRAAYASLENSLPLCLYFNTSAEREEFVAAVLAVKPNMRTKRVGS